MEEVSEEVVAYPQLRASGIWIAHGSEEACIESMIGIALST